MINADKGQEGMANIIEARNKYRMLRSRKERMAFITKVAKMFKYSRNSELMGKVGSDRASKMYCTKLVHA